MVRVPPEPPSRPALGTRQAPEALQPDAAPAPIDCRRCDAVCCRLPVLLQPGDQVPGQFLSRDAHGRAVMARNEEGWCAAIDPYHLRCTIYSQRPAICRQFSMGGDDCRRERQDYLRQADAWSLSSPYNYSNYVHSDYMVIKLGSNQSKLKSDELGAK